MKGHRVYLFIVLIGLLALFVSTGCARKSGCHDLEQTTKPITKKKSKARQQLFDKKTRRKM